MSGIIGGVGSKSGIIGSTEIPGGYEEGTFDPVITGSTSGSGTPTSSEGYYTKIGKLVTVSVYMPNVTFPTYEGSLRCSVPFTSSATAQYRGPDVYFYDTAQWDTGVGFNAKLMDGNRQTNLTSGNTTTSATGTLYLTFQITYQTA